MGDRDLHILTSAWAVFSRYGYGRATMNDIASEAGVARQTVYNAFPGKPEVLRAVVRHFADKTLAEVGEAWASEPDLGVRLDIFFEAVPVLGYISIEASPHAADLLDGLVTQAAEAWAETTTRWTARFVEMFEESGVTPRDPTVSLEDLADFVFSTAKNAKTGAQDLDALRARLRVIKASVLALVEAPVPE